MSNWIGKKLRLLWPLDSLSSELPKVLSFPPPYKGMLAFNSDVEFTRWPVQMELLASFAELELETSFSYWFFGDQKSTWTVFNDNLTLSPHGEAALSLMRNGLLDTLHGIGGRVHGAGTIFTREDVAHAYKVLNDEGIRPCVFSNHGTEFDRQNIGGDWASYQEGDLPKSPFYHLDLSCSAGIRFFWCDTDYEVNRNNFQADYKSDNSLLHCSSVRDGRRIIRFRRYLGKLDSGASIDNFANQLQPFIQTPISGYAIIFQHLGAHRRPDGCAYHATNGYFHGLTKEKLQDIAACQRRGELLITTTARLLMHALIYTARPWKIYSEGYNIKIIFISKFNLDGCDVEIDWDALEGFTLVIAPGTRVMAYLDSEAKELKYWKSGNVNYAGIPWKKLDVQTALEKARSLSP